jgi:hypothetical protein
MKEQHSDPLAGNGDDLDEDERAALHREIEASIAEAKAGQFIDADVVIAELRAMRPVGR